MTGRVIIVTGANTGLGYEVTRYLCEGGNDVILACRNEEKANRAIEKIKRTNPNALATYMQLDLASLESVKKFVDDFHQTGKKLHVLVNNGGVAQAPKDAKRQYSADNFEMTMGTNHLGHFLLTNLLLDDLKAAGADGGDARVVTVSSSVHDPEANRRKRSYRDLQPFDFDNFFLFNESTFNGLQAYKNSKMANIMFTYELARRLEGTGVTANCVCPGAVPSTELMRNSSGAQKFVSRYIIHGVLRFTKQTKTVVQGAGAVSALVSDEKYKETTGKYIKDGAEAKSSEESSNEDNQKKLWELSGGYCQMEGYEAIEVPPPPKEEEKKEEEKKEDAKEEEAKPAEGGETAEAETEGETKEAEGDKTEEGDKKEEEKEEEKKKEDAKEPEETKAEDKTESEPAEKAEEEKKE